jgi:hypothetical protein
MCLEKVLRRRLWILLLKSLLRLEESNLRKQFLFDWVIFE